MAIINLVEWRDADPSVFAWRYPETNLSMGTQLLVNESQEAVFFSKGEIADKFGPGRHTLSSANIPGICKLWGIPFGGKNPFTAEVWFVNKRAPLNIDWHCSKMMVSDSKFSVVPLVANGRYGLRIENAERFLAELVGNVGKFTAPQITEHFSGMIEQYTKNAIVNYISNNGVSVTEITARLTEIADAVGRQMAPFWAKYGLSIPGFFITDISIDESDPVGRKVLEAIASSSAQNIAGYTWQQEQAMKIANNAVSGPGGDMGILGMAMLTGAFGGGMGSFGSQMMQVPGQNQIPQNQGGFQPQQRQPARKVVYCSSCGKSYPSTSKFCPHCGNKYNPCPVCGADNSENAKRCVSCGTTLVSKKDMMSDSGYICPSCGQPVTPGTKFCPNCGHKL